VEHDRQYYARRKTPEPTTSLGKVSGKLRAHVTDVSPIGCQIGGGNEGSNSSRTAPLDWFATYASAKLDRAVKLRWILPSTAASHELPSHPRRIENPLLTAFGALSPAVPVYFDNITAAPPNTTTEYVRVNVTFGLTTILRSRAVWTMPVAQSLSAFLPRKAKGQPATKPF
jgi:hypothetical protein